jgi:predicted nuclease with TOPRIM domain
MMRTAAQAADRTDNAASKERLKNFMNELGDLQEKNQLSNLELEIAQKKYDLLEAQIALEETQNAKNTVRL